MHYIFIPKKSSLNLKTFRNNQISSDISKKNKLNVQNRVTTSTFKLDYIHSNTLYTVHYMLYYI